MQIFPAAHPNAPPFFSNRRGARRALGGAFACRPGLAERAQGSFTARPGRGRAGRYRSPARRPCPAGPDRPFCTAFAARRGRLWLWPRRQTRRTPPRRTRSSGWSGHRGCSKGRRWRGSPSRRCNAPGHCPAAAHRAFRLPARMASSWAWQSGWTGLPMVSYRAKASGVDTPTDGMTTTNQQSGQGGRAFIRSPTPCTRAGAAQQRKGHVGADGRAQSAQLAHGQARAVQLVHAHQHAGGVGAAAGHAGAHRRDLADGDVHPGQQAGIIKKGQCRLDGGVFCR